jgi:tetratricopeptide (TPR) repeat protein
MIRRFSPHRLAAVLALLALVMGVRLRANETAGAEHAAAAEKPDAPTEAKTPEAKAQETKAAPSHAEPEKPKETPKAEPKSKTAIPPASHAEKPEAAHPTAKAAGKPAEAHPGPAKPTEADEKESLADAKKEKIETDSLLVLGPRLTDRGDYEAAEIAFRQVLNNPKAALVDIKTALLGLARMHRKQGSLTKAVAIYERFLKDYPGDDRTPDALLDLGRTLRSLGIYKTAISRFYSVINSTLKLPGEGFDRYQVLAKTAQFEIAETYFIAGDFMEAAKFYARLRLLDLAPSDRARAHFKAAYSLKLQGDREAALTMLRSFIDQWPDDENVPEARYLMAVTLRELKRPQEAFAATLELLRTEKSRMEADPKRWAYWQRRTGNQLANDFFETGNTLNAHAIYTGLVELSPEPAWRLPLTYQIALCYERLGILDRARDSYKTIVDATATNPPADLAELGRMATWRLEHLAWRDGVARQVSSFFETTTGKQSTPAATPAAATNSAPLLSPSPAPVAPAPASPAAAAPTSSVKTASTP